MSGVSETRPDEQTALVSHRYLAGADNPQVAYERVAWLCDREACDRFSRICELPSHTERRSFACRRRSRRVDHRRLTADLRRRDPTVPGAGERALGIPIKKVENRSRPRGSVVGEAR